MSYPIVLIIGNHSDSSGDLLVKNSIPKLAKVGYNRYCMELPSTWSVETLLTKTSQIIENLQKNHASARNSIYIRPLTAKKETIELASKHFYCIQFIDDEKSILDLGPTNIDPPREVFLNSLPKRHTIMSDHLFRMFKENNGVIALLGPGHHEGIVAKLKQKGMHEQDIICHFPYANASPKESLMDQEYENIRKFVSYTPNEDAINWLGDKILDEAKTKSRPAIELKDSSQSQFLTDLFKVNFKTILRPEYYADAVLPAEQVTDAITNKLDEIGINYYSDSQYFVIPNVNTSKIANSIRLLQ